MQKVVHELMAGAYPELHEQRDGDQRWLVAEEESFGHTLEQGLQVLQASRSPKGWSRLQRDSVPLC